MSMSGSGFGNARGILWNTAPHVLEMSKGVALYSVHLAWSDLRPEEFAKAF
jgi:hypothetical protein